MIDHQGVDPSDELLAEHYVLVPSDGPFQRRARLLQALWRERERLPIGTHRGLPLGSRLAMPFAQETLANYLTETVRDVVRREVQDPTRSAHKLYRQPRIFEDLLSSQPLCFNLFGQLQGDLRLASLVFSELLDVAGLQVQAVEFEHSPGRGDPRFTADHSAFDVFLPYATPAGKHGFVAIEVKYAESLDAKPARYRARYDEVAEAMRVFEASKLADLRKAPLEQLWRDHLLAGSIVFDGRAGYERGTFAVVYPSANAPVASAVASYRTCLRCADDFQAITLETLLATIERHGSHDWPHRVALRYLGL